MGKSRRHILLVEENRDVQHAFTTMYGVVCDYALHVVASTREALGLIARQSVDVAVIDLSQGVEMQSRLGMIRKWREDGEGFPIIAITAQDYEGLVVEALAAGADDFMKKPFSFDELTARLERHMMRGRLQHMMPSKAAGIHLPDTSFSFAGATIHPDLKITFPEGRTVELSAKHLGILKEFARHAGALIKRDDLIRAVWGMDANTNSKSLDQYLYVLRRTFRESGIDLYDFVVPANRVGWRISENAVRRTDK